MHRVARMPHVCGEYALQLFGQKNKKHEKYHTAATYVKMRMGNPGEDVFRFILWLMREEKTTSKTNAQHWRKL